MGGFRILTSNHIHIEPNILTWSSFYTDLWAKTLPGWSPSMPISCKFSYGSKIASTRKILSTSRVSQIRRVFVERVTQYGERARQSLGYFSEILSRVSCTRTCTEGPNFWGRGRTRTIAPSLKTCFRFFLVCLFVGYFNPCPATNPSTTSRNMPNMIRINKVRSRCPYF